MKIMFIYLTNIFWSTQQFYFFKKKPQDMPHSKDMLWVLLFLNGCAAAISNIYTGTTQLMIVPQTLSTGLSLWILLYFVKKPERWLQSAISLYCVNIPILLVSTAVHAKIDEHMRNSQMTILDASQTISTTFTSPLLPGIVLWGMIVHIVILKNIFDSSVLSAIVLFFVAAFIDLTFPTNYITYTTKKCCAKLDV